MKFSEAQPILAAYSYLQHGLITSAQASKEGIDTTTMTRLVQKDYVRRIRRGVYILSGVAEDPLTDIRAAWLSTGPEVLSEERFQEDSPIVVSHASAASVFALGDITPSRHTFTSSKRKQSSAADISHRTADLPDADWEIVCGLPVTTVARTIRDLARDSLDGDQLYQVIADGVHDQRLSPSGAARVIDPYVRQYGSDSGDEMVAESLRRFPEHDSATEARAYSMNWGNAAMSALMQQMSREWLPTATVEQMKMLMQEAMKPALLQADIMRKISKQPQQVFLSEDWLQELDTLKNIRMPENIAIAEMIEHSSNKKNQPGANLGNGGGAFGQEDGAS